MVEKVEVVEENQAEENQAEEEHEQPVEVKTFPKRIQCPRCKGTGTWVSSRTGVRARTAGDEVAVDSSKPCPQCKGVKSIVIRLNEAQHRIDVEAKRKAKGMIEHDKRVAKAKIDAEAKAKKKAVDQI